MEERLLGSETEGPTDLKWRIWEESKKAWRITFPAMLSKITAFGMLVVTQAFIGHISQLDLSAFALTQTILVRFCNGILVTSCLYFMSLHFIRCLQKPHLVDSYNFPRCLPHKTSQLIHFYL